MLHLTFTLTSASLHRVEAFGSVTHTLRLKINLPEFQDVSLVDYFTEPSVSLLSEYSSLLAVLSLMYFQINGNSSPAVSSSSAVGQ